MKSSQWPLSELAVLFSLPFYDSNIAYSRLFFPFEVKPLTNQMVVVFLSFLSLAFFIFSLTVCPFLILNCPVLYKLALHHDIHLLLVYAFYIFALILLAGVGPCFKILYSIGVTPLQVTFTLTHLVPSSFIDFLCHALFLCSGGHMEVRHSLFPGMIDSRKSLMMPLLFSSGLNRCS